MNLFWFFNKLVCNLDKWEGFTFNYNLHESVRCRYEIWNCVSWQYGVWEGKAINIYKWCLWLNVQLFLIHPSFPLSFFPALTCILFYWTIEYISGLLIRINSKQLFVLFCFFPSKAHRTCSLILTIAYCSQKFSRKCYVIVLLNDRLFSNQENSVLGSWKLKVS